ncbi:hypothetical protein Csa_005100 [Cucumis sativus]|uniref:Uncharacterized protein n=1 Tax=Cucumis sativus TaxID=3659 RepID=A0A0A0KEA3_CUCSA|nr:hypothetical protein Csa_005100 [Cucumis sativus]
MVRRKERETLGIGCGVALCAVISPACEFARAILTKLRRRPCPNIYNGSTENCGSQKECSR